MSSNNPAQFNFYLNRQGAQGKQGEKGDQGFSPSITEGKNTLSEYTLLITNQSGTFETANLREHKEDRQGTYMRYDRDKGVEYAGAADIATEDNAGIVRLSGQRDFDYLGDETVLTPYRMATANPLHLAYVDGRDDALSGVVASITFETDIKTSESGGVTSTTAASDIYRYVEQWEDGFLVDHSKDYYLRQSLVRSTDGSITITNWQEKGIDLSVNLPPAYTLPIATPTTLGGIKIGEGLEISEDGTVTVTVDSYTLPPATTNTLGGVKPDGTTITVADDGTISSVGGGGGGGDFALNATSPLSLTTQQNNVIYNSSAQFQDGRLSAGYALNSTPITIPKTTTLTIDMPFNDGAGYEENSFDFKSFCFYLNPEPKGFEATDPVRTVKNNYDQFLVDLHPKDGSGEIRVGFNDSVHPALPANTNYILRYVFKQDNNVITLDTTSGIYDESGTTQVCTVNTSISDATPKSWEQLFTDVYFGIGGGSNKQFVLDDVTIKYDEVVLHPLRTGVETQTLALDYDDSLTVTSDGKLSLSADLSTVATTGSYNDLTDKPTIPEVPDNITTQGNTFNGANQLVQLDANKNLHIDNSDVYANSGAFDVSIAANYYLGKESGSENFLEIGNDFSNLTLRANNEGIKANISGVVGEQQVLVTGTPTLYSTLYNNCVLSYSQPPSHDDTNVTLYAGSKFVIPAGLNNDGTPKSLVVELQSNATVNYAKSTSKPVNVYVKSDGTINQNAFDYVEVYDRTTLSPTATTWCFDKKDNRYYSYSTSTQTWTAQNGIMMFARYIDTDSTQYFNFLHPITISQSITTFDTAAAGLGLPDYDSGITINSGFTAPENGFVIVGTGTLVPNTGAYMTIDGVVIFFWQVNGQHSSFTGEAIVAKGSTINLVHANATFYPTKGVTNA